MNKKINNIKAALFDIDGTLLDTKEFIFQSYEYTFKKHNLSIKSRDEISRLIGKSLEECYKCLFLNKDVSEFCKTHNAFQLDNLHLVMPFKNTKKILKKLKIKGLKIAAITTRARKTSFETLKIAGINNYFDFIVYKEDVKNLKPHPEPILKALKVLGIKPENAVMIGDSDMDIIAGKNAKTKTIGVTYGFHKDKIKESNPDFLINDISGLVSLMGIDDCCTD